MFLQEQEMQIERYILFIIQGFCSFYSTKQLVAELATFNRVRHLRLARYYPLGTGRKLNVHKTFRRRPGRLLNVLCTFHLRSVSRGYTQIRIRNPSKHHWNTFISFINSVFPNQQFHQYWKKNFKFLVTPN